MLTEHTLKITARLLYSANCCNPGANSALALPENVYASHLLCFLSGVVDPSTTVATQTALLQTDQMPVQACLAEKQQDRWASGCKVHVALMGQSKASASCKRNSPCFCSLMGKTLRVYHQEIDQARLGSLQPNCCFSKQAQKMLT